MTINKRPTSPKPNFKPSGSHRPRINEPVPQEDEKVIKTDNNTLFVEEKPPIFEPLIDHESNQPIPGIFEEHQGYTLYKLFLGDFMEESTGNHSIINKLQQGNPMTDVVELHISSYGGDMAELLELYNTLNSMYTETCSTFLNFGYSAGALAFLFGSERIVYEHSDWMIHSYSGGTFGKRDDMLTHIKHSDKMITKFFNKILGPYFTKKELRNINRGDDFWMDAEEMIKRGIATGIIIDGVYSTRDDYLDILDPKRVKKREKAEKKAQKEKINE